MAASILKRACGSFLRPDVSSVRFTREYSRRELRRRPLNVIDPVSGERTPVTPRGPLALQIKTDREGSLKKESRTSPKPVSNISQKVKNEAGVNSERFDEFETRQKSDANQRREPKNWTSSQNSRTFKSEAPSEWNQASRQQSDNPNITIPEHIKFKRLEPKDKRMGKLMVLLKSRKTREKSDKVVLEGARLIRDAIEAGAKAHSFFFSHLDNLSNIPVTQTQAEFFKVAHRDINTWSDLVTSQGLIGVFKRPQPNKLSAEGSECMLPLTLICDNVRESGNLGTILRSAIAAGCKRVLVSKGCVDIWEPKVLRAAAGVHFRAPILNNLSWAEIGEQVGPHTPVHLAVSLPMADHLGGIGETLESDSGSVDGVGDHETITEEHNLDFDSDSHDQDGETFDPDRPLKVRSHWAVDWRRGSALVIGGETEGLSQGAVALCRRTGGSGVHVPTRADVNSLNNSMAVSIILFEACRQHRE